jgi:hypothetical protein
MLEKTLKCPKVRQAEENGFDRRFIQDITKDFYLSKDCADMQEAYCRDVTNTAKDATVQNVLDYFITDLRGNDSVYEETSDTEDVELFVPGIITL